MACPVNIKVYISEQFVTFPFDYVVPQADVANLPVRNLIVYVPTEEDVQFVEREQLLGSFDTVLVYRHESVNAIEARAPRKNQNATIVYWNPVMPITEIGVGDTRVFSILLTNNLYSCNTIVIDTEKPLCPIEYHRQHHPIDLTNRIDVNGNDPLYDRYMIMDPNNTNFIISFDPSTSDMIKILNIKRILTMFGLRRVRAKFAINLADTEVDDIYCKMYWERVRRLMKGGSWNDSCPLINRKSLRYIDSAKSLLGIPDYARTTLDFVEAFENLIVPYHIIPEVFIKINTIENKTYMRIFCVNDSYAITEHGIVPNNSANINPIKFDYSDVSSKTYLNTLRKNLFERHDIYDIVVRPAFYNYFF
ncbi:ODV-EC43 [Alphabaculovirus altermyunipunctae]|uniref:ODV-EC43 n=1 Tax=Mythimna unipuncta nucleopolyhedrovirus TaxID=447897 RepID=A0A346TPN7_9ABAC|nr:ODV-EC43 [Mythimna unipuncta nucleopolyhedrovirus]AXU41547.1 ODV-EC43 [Mythimna unipuncta nucleopolyhedrovirus]